jgi:hypothetical protein
MLVLNLYDQGVDYDILREIAYDNVVPVEFHNDLETFENEAKQRIEIHEREEAQKAAKWEDHNAQWPKLTPASQSARGQGDSMEGLLRRQANEMQALREQVRELQSVVTGGRPRSRSPRGAAPDYREGYYARPGMHAPAPARPMGRYVHQRYQNPVKADPQRYGYGGYGGY